MGEAKLIKEYFRNPSLILVYVLIISLNISLKKSYEFWVIKNNK